jgi:hypothetical protein
MLDVAGILIAASAAAVAPSASDPSRAIALSMSSSAL